VKVPSETCSMTSISAWPNNSASPASTTAMNYTANTNEKLDHQESSRGVSNGFQQRQDRHNKPEQALRAPGNSNSPKSCSLKLHRRRWVEGEGSHHSENWGATQQQADVSSQGQGRGVHWKKRQCNTHEVTKKQREAMLREQMPRPSVLAATIRPLSCP
jgi:hypothetical protein